MGGAFGDFRYIETDPRNINVDVEKIIENVIQSVSDYRMAMRETEILDEESSDVQLMHRLVDENLSLCTSFFGKRKLRKNMKLISYLKEHSSDCKRYNYLCDVIQSLRSFLFDLDTSLIEGENLWHLDL